MAPESHVQVSRRTYLCSCVVKSTCSLAGAQQLTTAALALSGPSHSFSLLFPPETSVTLLVQESVPNTSLVCTETVLLTPDTPQWAPPRLFDFRILRAQVSLWRTTPPARGWRTMCPISIQAIRACRFQTLYNSVSLFSVITARCGHPAQHTDSVAK